MGLDFGASLMEEVMKALNMSPSSVTFVDSSPVAAAAAAAADDDDEDEDDDDDETVSGGSESGSSTSTHTDDQQLDINDDEADVDSAHLVSSATSLTVRTVPVAY